MNTVNAPEFSRNYGFWSPAEQLQIVSEADVAIGGIGGDGFQLGLKLARMGVGRLRVADPEVFEPENANRVPGATVETYGRKKVDVFREDVLKINPAIKLTTFDEGISEDNVSEFVRGASLVFDETELTHLELGTMLARAARKENIPNVLVMNVGFAAQVTSFHPKRGVTFEEFMGFSRDMPIEEVKKQKLQLSRCVPYIPPYVDMETLRAVEQGFPLPSIAPGVDIATAMGASQALLHIANGVEKRRQAPMWAPRIAFMDSLTFASGTTRFPRFSHYRYLGRMIAREMLHKNVKTGYGIEDRRRRLEVYKAEQASVGKHRTAEHA